MYYVFELTNQQKAHALGALRLMCMSLIVNVFNIIYSYICQRL